MLIAPNTTTPLKLLLQRTKFIAARIFMQFFIDEYYSLFNKLADVLTQSIPLFFCFTIPIAFLSYVFLLMEVYF